MVEQSSRGRRLQRPREERLKCMHGARLYSVELTGAQDASGIRVTELSTPHVTLFFFAV